MSTNFKSQEVIANLNRKDLFVKFTDLNNLKDYLPSDVEEFESNTDNCSFKIESLPKMSLEASFLQTDVEYPVRKNGLSEVRP